MDGVAQTWTMSLSHPATDSLWSPARRKLTIGLVLTITLVAFEALAVSTVMPIVADELGDEALYGWVFTAFMLGSLVGIVVIGGLIDERGLRTPFLAGVGLFAIGLLVGGLAPSMPVLIAARFVQGLGAGAIPPIAYVAIGRSLPEQLRPQMFATLSTAWVLPGVMGPAIAGVVGEALGWRWVFLGLLPLIAIAGSISLSAVARVQPPAEAVTGEAEAAASMRRRTRLAIVLAVGTGLFLAGLTSGSPLALVVLTITGGVIAIPAIKRLTPAGTLRAARGLPAAVLMRGFLTFTFFAVDAYVALALVEVRGETVIEAGISLTAATISWTIGSWIQARGSRRWGPDRFIRAGALVVVCGLALFTLVLSPAVPTWLSVPLFGLAGLGMGLAYAPTTLIVLREAPVHEQGTASSALSLTDALGTSLGMGMTGAVVAASYRATGSPTMGLVAGFGIAIAVGLIGLGLSGRLKAAGPVPDASGSAVPIAATQGDPAI